MIELFLRKTGEFYVIALDQERCLIPQKNITMAVKNAARHIFKKLPQCEIVCFRHVLKIKELNPRIRLGSQVAQIFIRIQDKGEWRSLIEEEVAITGISSAVKSLKTFVRSFHFYGSKT